MRLMERGHVQATSRPGDAFAILGRGATVVLFGAGIILAGCNSSSPLAPSPLSAPAAAATAGTSVQQLTISGPTTLQAGQSAQLTATILLSDGASRDVSASASWTSSNQGVCRLSSTATLTSMSAGTC